MERLDVVRTGFPAIPEVPWGAHLCLFYESPQDLVEILVAYGVAGLENGEAILLMTCDAGALRELEARLRLAVPDYDRRVAEGAIELRRPEDTYVVGGRFDAEVVLDFWLAKLREALDRGFKGVRANGDEAWLRPDNWVSFQRYEETLGDAIAGQHALLLCAYALDNRSANEILEVAHSHQIVLAKRNQRWEALEAADVGQTKRQLQALRLELEWRVIKRTEELSAANERLREEIVERTRVERALREHEARFRTVFEASPLMTSIARMEDGRMLDANPAFLRTFGFQRAEVIGRTSAEIGLWVDPAERERVSEMVRRDGSLLGCNFRWRSRDGRVLDMVGSFVVIDVDGQRCALAVAFDLTARRRAETALLEQQWLLNEAERLTGTGSWQWNLDDGKVIWSRELFHVHGQDPELFRPSYEAWLDLVHPEDRGAVSAAVDAARTGGKSFTIEHRIVRPDGAIRWLRSVGYSRRQAPQAERMIGYAIDITEQRDQERRVRMAAEQLTAMSRQLVDVQEGERRRLASELHDRVGQTLTAIGLNLDIVSRQIASSAALAERTALLGRLEDAAALLEWTGDAVADVAAEMRPPMLDDLGLMPALQWYARGFTSRTGINVTLRGVEDAARLPPDQELAVFRITQEALTNVAKHAKAQNVEIAFARPGTECRVSVCDDGIGPQGSATGRSDQGLGLITMRERATAIGGRFEFGPRDGGGSCVVVHIRHPMQGCA
jgi:PAS domain S-box-containing protein